MPSACWRRRRRTMCASTGHCLASSIGFLPDDARGQQAETNSPLVPQTKSRAKNKKDATAISYQALSSGTAGALRSRLRTPRQPHLQPLGIELDVDGEDLADLGIVQLAAVAPGPCDQLRGDNFL
jgi:hypothetical protein